MKARVLLLAVVALAACSGHDWIIQERVPGGTVTCVKSNDNGSLSCDWAHVHRLPGANPKETP